MAQPRTTPLEQARSEADRAGSLIDLIDTNFHRNGLRFPAELLQEPTLRYFACRSYAPEAKGASPARRAIAGFYAEQGCAVDPDRIVITASASESYSLLFQCLARSGDEVLLPSPGYPLFEHVASLARLRPRYYRLPAESGFALSAAELRHALTPRTRFIVLISPNNPTGRVASEAECDLLLDVCAANGSHLICDEVFSDLVYRQTVELPASTEAVGAPRSSHLPRPLVRAAAAEVMVFTINGVSKLFASPDLKLSWIAISGPTNRADDAVETLEIANDMYLSCSPLAQELLPVLFERGRSFRIELKRMLEERREILLRGVSEIPGLQVTVPCGGIHTVLRLTHGGDDERFAVQLLRATGVHLHPGYLYGFPDEGYLVCSFLKEPTALRRGLGRLKRFMHQRQAGSARQ